MRVADRYRLDTVIGRGGMGEVWRAFDEMLGRPVAVKLLLPQASDPTTTSRFRLEAQTAGRLHHPNVVAALDFGAHEDRLFLVMELVEGDSLARVLTTTGALPADRVARIAAETAAGLAAAHRQGIVHRDIKPANLLLDADGTLKIADFGIARFVDDPGGALTATGQIVGTSLYLAPERALGRPAGPASDVYALGCVLYQLLTKQTPFQGNSALVILHHHLDTAPTPPRQLGVGIPPAFENYLLGLLAKQPEERPTADEVTDWFQRGAWRGAPEPLPQQMPDRGRGPASASASASVSATAGSRRGTGPFVTGRQGPLPGGSSAPPTPPAGMPTAGRPGAAGDAEWSTTIHRAAANRSGRRRGAPRRSGGASRLIAPLAAVALFVGALLVGMALFSSN